ncbi:bifunctional diguanylate cyclase/phosphodiesterase [Rhizobium sp. L1K21]|uniref:putative bifunctional diguanylate cyclase/phosphodiesterase n=1 Tax=Rhizobium sp. L1K21 TaxID=2954933 RepID=UPI0020932EE6|nr:EAL domain-containing protein [Rhizobium sp. L1K21]MCO6184969.1 EAL domain-containing protein [Rhizobium sp. L1K21]
MKSIFSRIAYYMTVPVDDPELLRAQYQALSHQLPMMYFILMSSTWALAYTHFEIAPVALTVSLPLLLTAAAIARVARWCRSRGIVPTAQEALRALRQTNRLTYLIAPIFTFWSFALYSYGDAYTRSHVAFYMSITVISCIFSLMHLRSAALSVTAFVNTSFIIFFLGTEQPTFVAIAINILLVSISMLAILSVNYRNFAKMVRSQVETKALSDENHRLANLDSLTNLPNRRAFLSHLQTAFDEASNNGTKLSVGIIDLDGFKPVNDIYGHSTGDKLLVKVGKRLAALPQDNKTRFFRLGGDEFAFVSSTEVDNESAHALGSEIGAALTRPFAVAGITVQISASVGVAIYPDTASSHEALYDHADYAQYHGKRLRRGNTTIFTSAMDAKIHREAMLEQVLKQADLDQELSVVFQPIVDLETGKTSALEALARWDSPLLGRVSPAEFIPIAERSGVISDMTRTLLAKALQLAEKWPQRVRFSFNLSAQDLNTHESALAIAAIIGRSRFNPRFIDFEITETAFAHDFEQICRSAEMLRGLGCGLSLDDFGTGYSSLTRLHALPLTKIKIDRSFITGIDTNAAGYKIVKSLLALSRDMNLTCAIEGVETPEELETLKSLGARFIQGYIFSKPVAAGEVDRIFDEGFDTHPQNLAV